MRCGSAVLTRRNARRLRNARTLPLLQYVVSLAVVQAVAEVGAEALAAAGCAAAKAPDVRIKWPNDVYAAGQKLGGVLCGSTHADGFFRVTVGVGLNVTNATPSICLQALLEAAATAVGAPPPPPPRRERLLAAILGAYEALETRFVADGGFDGLLVEYTARWLHSGQRVTLVEAGRTVALTVQGLTRSGYLLARDDDGAAFELHPDGNSLDFFAGLIRRKIQA